MTKYSFVEQFPIHTIHNNPSHTVLTFVRSVDFITRVEIYARKTNTGNRTVTLPQLRESYRVQDLWVSMALVWW